MRTLLSTGVLTSLLLIGAAGESCGDAAVRLTTDDSAADSDPAWSPDGNWIAFTRQAVENVDVYRIPATGGAATNLTADSSNDADPSWSPDGSQIVYRSNRELLPGHGQNLWIRSVSSGNTTQLTFSSDYDWNPAWSPDGTTVCFARGLHTYERALWVVRVVGYQEEQLINGVAHTPAWSPDGSQIAFAAKPNGFWHLFVVSAAGGAMTQVTPNLPWSSYVDDPTWSPNGQQIAYLANSQSSPEPQIWIIAATGGSPFQLTDGDGTDKTPAWSPDGNQIAFSSNRQGTADIWVIPVTTTTVEANSWSSVKQKYIDQ